MPAPDPGGIFRSDTHRRVLGHLSLPGESFGWTAEALAARIAPDQHTPVDSTSEVAPVLADLVVDGHADLLSGGVYRQTASGHMALTGPIANEPGPDPDPDLVTPALLGGPTAPDTGPTTIPDGSTEVTP